MKFLIKPLQIPTRNVFAASRVVARPRFTLRCFDSQNTRQRTFSSSSDATTTKAAEQPTTFDFRVSRLGLAPQWIQPSLPMLLQLPEILHAADALAGKKSSSSSSTTILDSELERASQVMEGMQRGGPEHLATLALRAELQQRLGHHQLAHELLCQLESVWQEQQQQQQNYSAAFMDLTLAKAKCLWYMGEFDHAWQYCDDLLDTDEIQEMPLHYASALTGSAVSKLLSCTSIDEAYTIRDPFRMAVKCLEMYSNQLGPALIAANLNLGVAEVVYGQVVGEARDVQVPLDPALKTWTTAITLLERRQQSPKSPSEQSILNALDVRLQANMAWGVLGIDDDSEDIVPRALEFSGKALKTSDGIDTIDNRDKEYFRRVLTILARAYHKAGKAVTAEGLLQSATTLPSIGCTLTTLDERSALQAYSKLCQDWDRRQGESEKYKTSAKELEQERLPAAWQGKQDVCSSLWFWTPSEFFY